MSDRCFLCEADAFVPRFDHPPYTVRRCRRCGLVGIAPRPEPHTLYDIYQESYFKSPSAQHIGYQDYLGEFDNYLKTFRRRYECVRPYLQNSDRVLEVGSACGAFLKVLKEHGFADLTGVEISRFAIDQAKAVLNGDVDLRHGYLKDHDFETPFDVVVMWDVIEHMPEPLVELRRLHANMRPGGHLILETQDERSVLAKLAGRRWHMYKFPEHIHHFNQRTVTRMLEMAGFSVVTITKRAAGKYVSGDFLFERVTRYCGPLKWAIAPWRRRMRHVYLNPHDEMIVVARRDDVL